MAESKVKTIIKGFVNPEIKIPGKTVIITGANTGIGLATAVDLAKREARVIIACRNMEKGEEAKKKIVEESKSENVVLKKLDLSSFESIREFATDINATESSLDILINNAGVMMCPPSETKDGFELQFGTNHLGHFLMTNLLLDLVKKSAPARIIHVSSTAHYGWFGAAIHWDDLNFTKNYDSIKAYGQSKLCNVLFSRELSKKLQGTGVTSNSLEPGAVKTDLQRHVGTHDRPSFKDRLMSLFTYFTRWAWSTPEKGAQTSIYLAVAPELAEDSGKYYADCKLKEESADAKKDDFAERLWKISEELTGLKPRSEGEEVKQSEEPQKTPEQEEETQKTPEQEEETQKTPEQVEEPQKDPEQSEEQQKDPEQSEQKET